MPHKAFITNTQTQTLKKRLTELIEHSRELKFLVGFFYFSGWAEIYETLKDRTDLEIKVLVGLDVDKKLFSILEYAQSPDNLTGDEKADSFFESLSIALNSEELDVEDFYKQVNCFAGLIEKDKLIIRKTAEKFTPQDVKLVGINSNSPNTYEEDSFENMVKRMKQYKFPWLYLYDATQDIARAYGALRTPHFFIFNEERKLVYTGRGVDNPRETSKMTVNDLENALDELLAGKQITTPITNPIGCNVKWEGKDAHWMPPDACDLV
ncbi:MAG: redoxin family protein [Sedimentisphaerales bacterium]